MIVELLTFVTACTATGMAAVLCLARFNPGSARRLCTGEPAR